MPRDVTSELRKLGVVLVRVFRHLLEITDGNVIVVSNADKGWLDLSIKHLGPTESFFKLKKIPIISARTLHEAKFDAGADQKFWKAAAFVEECKKRFDKDQTFKLISIGDSPAEEMAAQHVAAVAKKSICHSIRFIQEPTIKQLTHQIALVEKEIKSIFKEKECNVYLAKETREYQKWCDDQDGKGA